MDDTEEQQPRKQRKTAERFGPVATTDLERIQKRIVDLKDFEQDVPELLVEVGHIVREMDKLILRSKMAESEARKARRAAARSG